MVWGQNGGLARRGVGGVDDGPRPRGVDPAVRSNAGGGAHGSGSNAPWGSRHVGRPLSIIAPRGRGTRDGVPEMLFEPLEQRGQAVEGLLAETEAFRKYCDEFVTGLGPRHVAEHELAGELFSGGHIIVDFSGMGATFNTQMFFSDLSFSTLAVTVKAKFFQKSNSMK